MLQSPNIQEYILYLLFYVCDCFCFFSVALINISKATDRIFFWGGYSSSRRSLSWRGGGRNTEQQPWGQDREAKSSGLSHSCQAESTLEVGKAFSSNLARSAIIPQEGCTAHTSPNSAISWASCSHRHTGIKCLKLSFCLLYRLIFWIY